MAKRGRYKYGAAEVQQAGFAAIAMGSVDELAIFKAPYRCKIVKVGFSPAAAITGAATNNFAIGFNSYEADGTSIGSIALRTYASGTDAVAFSDEEITSDTAPSNNLLAEGSIVTCEKTENGTGLASPDLLAYVEFVKR